jgi:hypothetical protein
LQNARVPASFWALVGAAHASIVTVFDTWFAMVVGLVQTCGMHRLSAPASALAPHSPSVRQVWKVPSGHAFADGAEQEVEPWTPIPMIVWQHRPPLQSLASLHASVCVAQPVFGGLHVSEEPASVFV